MLQSHVQLERVDSDNGNKPLMKSALLFGLQDLRLVDTPIPKADPKGVVVRVDACGICPSDIRKYHTIYSGAMTLPANLGHEFVGTVVDIGDEVNTLQLEQRIVGVGYVGYAQYASMPLEFNPPLHTPQPLVFSNRVSDAAATFVEPLACCIHAVDDQAALASGQSVLIVGGGTMGQLMLMVAKDRGLRTLVAEPYAHRRSKAEELGVDAVFDPGDDLSAAVREANAGERVDAAILTIGNPDSVQDCVMSVVACGRVVLFGRFPDKATIRVDPSRLYRDEVHILGSNWIGGTPTRAHPDAYRKAVDLIESERAPVDALVSGVYPLSRIHEAFAAASSMETFKIILTPHEAGEE